MDDRKRAGLACMVVIVSQILRQNHRAWVYVIGTVMLLSGFFILFPALKRQCNGEKSRVITLWLLSVIGILVVLANAVLQTIRLVKQ